MKPRELANLGVPRGEAMKVAVQCVISAAKTGVSKDAIRSAILALVADPVAHQSDPHFGPLATSLIAVKQARSLYQPRPEPAPWRQWGSDLEPTAVQQLRNACNLPVAVAGALMPDAHQGYGLPIGGVLGIIPGSMGTAGYVVRGRGQPESLNSASHGTGRKMSRTAAKARFTWHDAKKFLAEHNVDLISAGLDEVPMAYKDIETVMAAQADLVEPVARFNPRLVKMAEGGERPED